MTDDPFAMFGKTVMGPRPSHPDFAILVDLVLQHDGKTEDASYDMDADLAAICDPRSISYMALQRSFRMVAMMGKNPLLETELVIQLASLWIDAFMLASDLAARRTLPQ